MVSLAAPCIVCGQTSEGWFDDDPVCLDCADRMLDRLEAIGILPALRSELPSLDDFAGV